MDRNFWASVSQTSEDLEEACVRPEEGERDSPVSITRRPKWGSMMTVFRFSNSFSRMTP